DVEAERTEDVEELGLDARDGVETAGTHAAPRERDVEEGAFELGPHGLGLDGLEPRREQGLDGLLELVYAAPEVLLAIARDLGHPLHRLGELALRADVLGVPPAELVLVVRRLEGFTVARLDLRDAALHLDRCF